MALIPIAIKARSDFYSDGVDFFCPCHGGTRFTLYTKANVPYASCPVCGTVREPQAQAVATAPMILPFRGFDD